MFERIIFLQTDDETTNEALNIFEEQGAKAAIKHLSDWHYPGEHDTSDEPGAGRCDDMFQGLEFGFNGYILTVSLALGYIGLEFDTNHNK